MSSKLSVYISNLGEYVAGVLRGTWVKLPIPQEDLDAILASIGLDAQHSEYFIRFFKALHETVQRSCFLGIHLKRGALAANIQVPVLVKKVRECYNVIHR